MKLLLQESALSHSQELFDQADTSKDGKLQLGEVRDILRKSSEEYSHFAEHARFLDGYALSPPTILSTEEHHLKNPFFSISPCILWLEMMALLQELVDRLSL